MKPHPTPHRIRKTIKWGGAAVTVLLVVVWVATFWWGISWYHPKRGSFQVCAGGITGFYHTPSQKDSVFTGWRIDEIDETTVSTWWFSAAVLRSWSTWSSVSVPVWCPIVVSGLATVLAWRLDTLARRRAKLNLCPKCGYDRTGILQDAKCPECGLASVSV